MLKRMMVVMVLSMVSGSLAQGALLDTTTVDPLHIDYDGQWRWGAGKPGTVYWEEKSDAAVGFGDKSGIFTSTADPNDPEWPQYGIQRFSADDFMFGYRTASGSQFSQVEICTATLGEIDTNQIGFSYANGNSTYTGMTATEVIDRGWMQGGWMGAVLRYNLNGINPDRVRITMQGGAWYTPMISSVKLDVVPEPATMGLLAMGGLLGLRRRK